MECVLVHVELEIKHAKHNALPLPLFCFKLIFNLSRGIVIYSTGNDSMIVSCMSFPQEHVP